MKTLCRGLLQAVGLSLALGCLTAPIAYAAPPAKAFGELPVAFDADLSPDGKRLAVIVNSNGQYYVATRETGSGSTQLVGTALGGSVRPLYVKWVNNDRYFVSFLKMEEADGIPYSVGYIYTQEEGEKSGRILIKPKFFRQFNNTIVNWLDDDPDHVLMSYTTIDRSVAGTKFNKTSKAEWPGVFKVKVKNGKGRPVESSQEYITHWLTDPSGNPVFGMGINDGAHKMIVKDVESDNWSSHNNFPGLNADTPIFSV